MQMIAETSPITQAPPASESTNLTKLQFLYWISQVMRPDAAFLNTLIIFDLPGQVDEGCFELAFETVVRHSDSLRTVIVEQDGTPQRVVLDEIPASLEQLDLSGEVDPSSVFETWLAERATRPFSLTTALYDTVLVKLADAHYRWYINQHHIIADAQAFFATFNYLKLAYETAVTGQHDIQLGLPAYQTYVDYEFNFRQSKRYEKAGQYWVKKLNPGPNPVRFNGVAPVKKGASVTQLSVDLGIERSKKLSKAALGKNVFTLNEELSTYNLLAALFFIQLQKMSQNERLGVVTPVHNRTTDEFRETVGLFMEMCPLQLTLGEDETFDSVIKKLRKETRSTMPQAQYGSALSLPGETFDVMFNMHQVPEMSLNGIPVGFRKFHPGVGSESFACHIHQYMDNGRFLVHLDFHDDLFTAEQRQETADHFVALIDAFLEDSSQSLNLTFSQPIDLAVEDDDTAVDTPTRPDYEAPRDAMENQMARLWEEVLGVQKIGIHDNFFDSGGSSFLASKLFLRVQEVMGQKLPLSTLLEAKTVAQMVATMRANSEGKLWSKTVTMKPGKAGSQALFFVPGAGGSLIRLDALMGLLSDDLRVVAFQLPGVDSEDGRPFQSIEEGASYFIDVMREIQPDGPYRITGYSWGGMIAFNMAYQLVQAGHEVEFLAIIDTPAQNPHYRVIKTAVDKYADFRGLNKRQKDQTFLAIRDKAFRLEYFIRSGFRALNQQGVGYVTRVVLRKAKSLARKVSQKSAPAPSPAQQNSAQALQKQGQSGGDFWSRFNLDQHRLRFVRTNDRSIRLYIPQAYPGKAVVFQSSKGYRNPLNRSASPHLGWRAVIKGGVESHMIPGDHLGMLVDPNVKVLAAKLQAAIDKTIKL